MGVMRSADGEANEDWPEDFEGTEALCSDDCPVDKGTAVSEGTVAGLNCDS